ncbi:MAG TPA: hypothetical protein VFK68_10280, partial [Propionibacteriaceae bacterium]|nr:hypothetical protein [Propionibacteriaceae bacterium]
TVESHYYQPLPTKARRADGDYELEFEGRFAAQMAFSQRTRDTVSLETRMRLVPLERGVALDLDTAGVATRQLLELAVLDDTPLGHVTGGSQLRDARTAVVHGDTTFAHGRVTLEVQGPLDEDASGDYNPGEAYTFLSGTDAFPGARLLVPFRSPSSIRLVLTST